MSTPSTGDQVVVTPVFWAPTGYSFDSNYQSVIDTYLANVAHDSESTTNVFASLYQYSGSNGNINYHLSIATPIIDTEAFPPAGCTTDTGAVYADNSGYLTCLDDAQLDTELGSVISTHHLNSDLGHMEALFLPKGVESCFFPASDLVDQQQCTVSSSPSSAYCAYHSMFGTTGAPKIYAVMPYPVYDQPNDQGTCAGEGLAATGPDVESPNNEPDADVEISLLSHETSESISDPEGDAWYDAKGNEDGDDCAYIYGALSGAPGALYNQTINGAHYLTQEEFSNADYVRNVSGCVQSISPVVPTVASVVPSGGSASGGGTVTITGTGFAGASAVKFGATSTSYTVNDPTSITATVPAGSGVVDVRVSTGAGTSATSGNDQYVYSYSVPTVTSVSPNFATAAGGRSVTVTGTGFSSVSNVSFGGSSAGAIHVVSTTQLTVIAPAHSGGVVDVTVTTPGGTSAPNATDRFVYLAAPTVTKVSPNSGPTSGGTKVTITGTGFTAGSVVTVGGRAATRVVVVSARSISARVPAHAAGAVDVRVRAAGGTSAAVKADRFTYLSKPRLRRLSSTRGRASGGQTVTITGRHFVRGAKVRFGSATAVSVKYLSSTRLRVRTPKHARGAVNVYVTTRGGTSAKSSRSRYRFR